MRRTTRRSKNRKKKQNSRPFSIAFLIAIPGNFIIGALALISIAHLIHISFIKTEIGALFASGFLSALVLVGTAKISRLRVLVHEIKHAVMVILTGNSLKGMQVKSTTGHVEFGMYENRMHFAPIISLAPYFLPLFSLPVLVACILIEASQLRILAMLLGASLATDMSMAYTDLHPHQSDLQKVTGGPFFGLLYLASAHFLWVTICMLWVVGGRSAYVYSALFLANVFKQFAGG